MNEELVVEIKCQQKNHEGERICGDVFQSLRVKEENRIIIALADGIGHGVKANVMATLTSTMALNFAKTHKENAEIVETIMNTLPEDSEKKLSFSTFTLVDIQMGSKIDILEYGNPKSIIIRNREIYKPESEETEINSRYAPVNKIRSFALNPQKEDRIIIVTDGVTQSGLGSSVYPSGFGDDRLCQLVQEIVNQNPLVSAGSTAIKILGNAYKNDAYICKDDMSCLSIYVREPRKLLIVTGPPFEDESDKKLAQLVKDFKGKKIICGATTADILSREFSIPVEERSEFSDKELPPTSHMDGFDMVTEGILTLSKVARILRDFKINYPLGKGPADQIVKHFIKSDEIHFITGTRINPAHQGPDLPVELEIRRTVVSRIARLLEEKLLKKVVVHFI